MEENGQKSRWIVSAWQTLLSHLPHALFFFLFLPLTLLLLMIPSSWYHAEGYIDLGVVDFVASRVDLRVRDDGPYDHAIIYLATDGSGLSFREYDTRVFAHAAVDRQQHVQRRVYLPREKPNAILRLSRYLTGQIFLPLDGDLQAHLRADRLRNVTVLCVSLLYILLYASAALLRRRRRSREEPPMDPLL